MAESGTTGIELLTLGEFARRRRVDCPLLRLPVVAETGGGAR